MTLPAVTMQLCCVGTRRKKSAVRYCRLPRFSMYPENDTDLQNIIRCETVNKPPQLIQLLNANLDFRVGTTVQVVCTKYEISKWK